ncbi:MAG TPA: hypothetical protein VFC74_05965 [Oscillospiraceae bacterium]|nr:hypothetical protein [Oscillospiraceae bacterium]
MNIKAHKLAPIYERQVTYILEALVQGQSRKELAQKLGYTNAKSLDNYMRRKNFSWSRQYGTFIPTISKTAETRKEVGSNSAIAATALALFSQQYEAKEVATQLGFQDHRELYDFMNQEEYQWDAKHANYHQRAEGSSCNLPHPEPAPVPVADKAGTDLAELISYLPLLRKLQKREQLTELLEAASSS